jgi:hypothetical protein
LDIKGRSIIKSYNFYILFNLSTYKNYGLSRVFYLCFVSLQKKF